jgi:hypothetical protein
VSTQVDGRHLLYQAMRWLVALAIFTVASTPASAMTPAVQDERFITCGTPTERAHALKLAKQLGVRVVRINALNTREWRYWGCDPVAAARAVHAAGLRPQITVIGNVRYAVRLARRLGPIVRTWSVWNEPNHPSFRWGPITRNPASYGRFYRRASRAIRRADKGAKVLFGELIGGISYTARIVRRMRIKTDGLAIHPYTWGDPGLHDRPLKVFLRAWRKKLPRWAARGRFCRAGRRRCVPPPIYATEFGYMAENWEARGYERWVSNWKEGVPDSFIVDWLPAAWRIMRRFKVRQVVQYQLIDSGQGWDTALVDEDGRRPQFDELARYIKTTR